MNTGIEFTMKLSAAYSAVCRPLCHELNLPQTAFDILMFLANNPEYTTARDIVEIRKIKANLVSINVDKLVGEGYLLREADAFVICVQRDEEPPVERMLCDTGEERAGMLTRFLYENAVEPDQMPAILRDICGWAVG